MQSFFITNNQSTFGGQSAPNLGGQCGAKKGGQFARNFQYVLISFYRFIKNYTEVFSQNTLFTE